MWSEERALWALEKRNGEKAWNIDFPCSNLKKATIVFQWKLLSVRRRSAAATVGDDEVRMYLTVWILSVLLLKETHLCFTTRSSEKIKLNKIRVYLSAFSVCQEVVYVSAKLRLLEHRQQRISEVRAKYQCLKKELEQTKQYLMLEPHKWTTECKCGPLTHQGIQVCVWASKGG